MIPPRPPQQAPFEADKQVLSFDWSTRLSIDMIRNHTKTDDIPGVTDAQLELYRGAALEAAEMYTGQLLAGWRTITEPVQGPRTPRPGRLTYKHELRYPVADGYVYLYGGSHASENRTFRVPLNTRVIQVPITKDFIDLSNCCDPCSSWNLNGGMMAAYKAGYENPEAVPSGIVLGCLQYLAWIVEHPGDELLTQRNRKDNSTKIGGVSGSNNIAMVSGALETWRLYDESAI